MTPPVATPATASQEHQELTPQEETTHLLIGHSVVPPEESCGDVVRHHHVHSVVVMR